MDCKSILSLCLFLLLSFSVYYIDQHIHWLKYALIREKGAPQYFIEPPYVSSRAARLLRVCLYVFGTFNPWDFSPFLSGQNCTSFFKLDVFYWSTHVHTHILSWTGVWGWALTEPFQNFWMFPPKNSSFALRHTLRFAFKLKDETPAHLQFCRGRKEIVI